MLLAVIEPTAWRPDLDQGPEATVAGVYGRTDTVYGPWHGVVWVERYLLDDDFEEITRMARQELEDEMVRQSRRRAREA